MARVFWVWMALLPVCGRAQQVRLTDSAAAVPVRLTAVPADLAIRHYGFFCRQELKWDQKLPVPVRFRLGSQEACDKLEGKYR